MGASWVRRKSAGGSQGPSCAEPPGPGLGVGGGQGEKCAFGPEGVAEPEGFPDPPAFTEHLLCAFRRFGCWGCSSALDGGAPSVALRETVSLANK